MSDSIDIKGIDKADLLNALYSRAQVLGLGALHAKPGDLTPEEAAVLVIRHTDSREERTRIYFDYLHGRVMKVDIGGDVLNGRLYDRDNGQGAAAAIVAALRAKAPIPGQPTVTPPPPANPQAFVDAHHSQIQTITLDSTDA